MPSIGKDAFVHCNKNGEILFEHKFIHSVDTLNLLSEKEAVVLVPKANKILVIDVISYTIK
jgi:hypothetical protein